MNLLGRIKKLILYRSILWEMSLKQFKAKYSGSILGIWWTVITPLILAVSINFIFTQVFSLGIKNFTLFVLSGIIAWLLFSNALSEASNSFIVNSALLKQGIFPRELIPISSVVANFLNFILGLLIILPLFIIADLRVILVLPFLVLTLIFYLFFLIGFALLFSSLNVFFRDLSHLLPTAFMIWFWITPIFYSVQMLPAKFRWVCLANPVTHYVVSLRRILFEAEPLSFFMIFGMFLVSLILFLIGYIFFLKKEQRLLKRI